MLQMASTSSVRSNACLVICAQPGTEAVQGEMTGLGPSILIPTPTCLPARASLVSQKTTAHAGNAFDSPNAQSVYVRLLMITARSEVQVKRGSSVSFVLIGGRWGTGLELPSLCTEAGDWHPSLL